MGDPSRVAQEGRAERDVTGSSDHPGDGPVGLLARRRRARRGRDTGELNVRRSAQQPADDVGGVAVLLGDQWPYVLSVTALLVCPRRLLTVVTGTPAASSWVAR